MIIVHTSHQGRGGCTCGLLIRPVEPTGFVLVQALSSVLKWKAWACAAWACARKHKCQARPARSEVSLLIELISELHTRETSSQ